jgi:polar amino acid transport system substrate-binding protein
MARTLFRTIGLLGLLGATACDIPRDPAGTLDRASGDTLRVGVTEARPWVIRQGDQAGGVEVELVRRFARSIDAEVHWSWGTAAEHMHALTNYDLDLVIGGFERGTPWRKHVGLTVPYHTTRVVVAGPPGSPRVTEESLDGRPVAVTPGGATAAWVRSEDGEPYPLDDLSRAPGLLAAPTWELAKLGRDTLGVEVGRHQHVMAVPPGENRLLMALEDALHGAGVATLLRKAEGGS